MLQRKPKAEPRAVTFAGDVRVDANSPKWLQRIAYRCAVGLRHDEGSDFRQWGAEQHTPIGTTHGGSLEKIPTSWLLIGRKLTRPNWPG